MFRCTIFSEPTRPKSVEILRTKCYITQDSLRPPCGIQRKYREYREYGENKPGSDNNFRTYIKSTEFYLKFILEFRVAF
jgi:hypothetical protein